MGKVRSVTKPASGSVPGLSFHMLASETQFPRILATLRLRNVLVSGVECQNVSLCFYLAYPPVFQQAPCLSASRASLSYTSVLETQSV